MNSRTVPAVETATNVSAGCGQNAAVVLVSCIHDIPDIPCVLTFILSSDLCPKPSDAKNPLSKQSHYEELEGIPGLFNALLEDPDDDKWSVFTFPVDYDTSLYGADTKDSQFYLRKSQCGVDR